MNSVISAYQHMMCVKVVYNNDNISIDLIMTSIDMIMISILWSSLRGLDYMKNIGVSLLQDSN